MKKLVLTILLLMTVMKFYGQMDRSERYIRGWEKLQTIDGDAGEKVVNGLQDISPALSQFIIEYSFGDVYSSDKLDDKSKEVAAVASLIAQRAIPEMKVHLNAALNTGNTINEVKEIIIQMAVYVGFPKAIAGMNTFREVLAERKAKGIVDREGTSSPMNDSNVNRYELGASYLSLLDKQQVQAFEDTYRDFLPELIDNVIEFGFGDVYSRESLDKRDRQIATIAALTTIGALPQLKFHIKAGLNVGLSVEEIKGILLLVSVYTGFPASINGINILKEIVEQGGAV